APRGGAERLRGKREHGVDAEVAVAAAYLAEHHGVSESGLKVKSAYRSEHTGVTHVYFKQVVNGLEVANGNANVNIDRHGRVISSGNSFAQAKADGAEADSEGSWVETVEAAVAGTWEAAQDLAVGAFGMLANEVSNEVDRVKEIVDGIADRLHIQGAFRGQDVIDLVDAARAGGRQRAFAVRDSEPSSYVSVKEAVRRLAHHLKSDLHPHQLAGVQVGAATNVDGDAELQLSGLPRRFAVDGRVAAQAVLLRLDDGTLAEAWDLTVEQDDHWWNAQVDARTGKVASLVDWSNNYVDPESFHATGGVPEAYRVYPWTVADPSEGERVL
ncbi:hypothetical protein GGF45_006276, partial [Coemansia sp. RSA 551]